MDLDPQPRRDHEQGRGAGLRKLDFFRFRLFLNSSATDIVLVTLPSTAVQTAIARCTSIVLSGLFRAVSAIEPSLFRPFPPLSPSLISNLASADVKQHGQGQGNKVKVNFPYARFGGTFQYGTFTDSSSEEVKIITA